MSSQVAKKQEQLPGNGKKGIPLRALLKTAMQNPALSNEEIAKIHGVTRENVRKRLLPYADRLQAIKEYWEDPETALILKEQELLVAMDSDKIAKASLKDTATSYGIISDKRRLEQGKSTSNQATQVILRVIREDEPLVSAPSPGPAAPEVPISTAGDNTSDPSSTT